jgi:uncharacterized Zn finger protein
LRRAAKRDTAEADIVSALEATGCIVYRDLPADLLIHRQSWGAGWFRVQEVKTGREKTKKTQHRQTSFLTDTGSPIVRTAEEALADVGVIKADAR